MAGYQMKAYSPAGDKPRFFYFNETGTFELAEDIGTAVYAWPPQYHHNGDPRNDGITKSYHDRLAFMRWDIMQLPGGKEDFGWIYKCEGQDFYLYFSSQASTFQPTSTATPYSIFRLYYSTDDITYYRWKTVAGTRRLPLHGVPDEQTSTDIPGEVSQVPGSASPASEMRFGLGTHKLPNEYRICPNNPFSGKRNHGGDSRSFSLKIWVDVKHPTIEKLKSDVLKCLQESSYSSLIAAIIAAYYSGGNPAAAWTAFYTTFYATFPTCIKARTNETVSFTLEKEEIRGEWSGKH